jgi:hypothetical protein
MDINSLKTGDEVTIHPRHYPGDLDTEAGAQPWKAEFIGHTTDDQIIIRERDEQRNDPYSPGASMRIISADLLDPNTARQRF